MSHESVEVRRLLEERTEARAGGDFKRADELRERIRELGWMVVDTSDGARLESLLDRVETFAQGADAPSRLAAPDTCEYSVCVVMAGWPEDVRRLASALAGGRPANASVEMVIVDRARLGLRPRELLPEAPGGPALRVLRVESELGHAQAWTLAAHQAGGRLLVFSEPSLEFGMEVLEALSASLADSALGVAGPFGLRRRDAHHFEEAPGPDVDALEYLLAMRRSDFSRVGDFDPHFRFYRILDIDFSHQVRAAGLGVRAVPGLAVRRHQHRVWESMPADERERLSRRNYNRFLDRWGRTGART